MFNYISSPTQASAIIGKVEHWTLGRWVSDILHKAGIHTKTSKTCSLRSSSTSNALSGGISLTEIEKTARWKNVKTFGKCYNKPMIDNNLGIFLLTNSLQICA